MDKTALLQSVCRWYGAECTIRRFINRFRITIGYYTFGEDYVMRVYKTVEDALADWLPTMRETAEHFARCGQSVWRDEIGFIQKECC